PVFHEIAENNATYVGIENSQTLANDLSAALQRVKDGTAPRSLNLHPMSWDESAEALREIIYDEDWYWAQHAPDRSPPSGDEAPNPLHLRSGSA
ncbi:MAG: hypothetical protein ACLP1D_19095, partial [Xanthobacteraceae bacterium]